MDVIKCEKADTKGGESLTGKETEAVIGVLKDGGLIVYPTETLYALGTDPMNKRAMNRLLEAKGRPKGMPLSVAVAGMDEAARIAILDERALSLMRRFMPGPLTVVARIRENTGLHDSIPNEGKVGIRIPDHAIPLMLTKRFGPLTATSANRHRGKNPTDIAIARKELGNDVDIYINCGRCRLGAPSTVIDVSEEGIKVIREGAISREMLDGRDDS